MTTVFMGGSRKFRQLNRVVRSRILNVVEREFQVVVGDAAGSDRAIQACLAEESYSLVTIYCTGATCRNNLGGWPEEHVTPPPGGRRDFRYYAAKDLAMAEVADFGLMLWDGVSVGTTNNMLNLVERDRKVVVYHGPSRACIDLRDMKGLRDLLGLCERADLDRFERRLRLRERLGGPQGQFHFA